MTDIVTLFLCGDVMLGRGIDQILPHPCDPRLYEPYVKSARGYVEIAERTHGPIPHPVPYRYVWGDALSVLDSVDPDLRIVNLETAVTRSDDFWRRKGIHYRMSPENAACLREAGIDGCSLANNHVMDWGVGGLVETLKTLHRLGIGPAGAGLSEEEARSPSVLRMDAPRGGEIGEKSGHGGRTFLFAGGSVTSGVPESWAAGRGKPGVNVIRDYSPSTLKGIAEDVRRVKKEGDIVVYSIHWGGNWDFSVSSRERNFAHALIDRAGVDIVWGHSSHHVKGMEVYREKLILYGCGDFINDYEGITGHRGFRGDLGLMYFPRVDRGGGKLAALRMVPVTMKRFKVVRVGTGDARWLYDTLNREGRSFGTGVRLDDGDTLILEAR
jgi:poly-gamma-glutamate capsule biosynthesis protein CapA/YwtB (metallophosphatase superfamily)